MDMSNVPGHRRNRRSRPILLTTFPLRVLTTALPLPRALRQIHQRSRTIAYAEHGAVGCWFCLLDEDTARAPDVIGFHDHAWDNESLRVVSHWRRLIDRIFAPLV